MHKKDIDNIFDDNILQKIKLKIKFFWHMSQKFGIKVKFGFRLKKWSLNLQFSGEKFIDSKSVK